MVEPDKNAQNSPAIDPQEIYNLAPIGICIVESGVSDPHILFCNDAFLTLINADRILDDSKDFVPLTADGVQNSSLKEIWPSTEIAEITEAIEKKKPVPSTDVAISDTDIENRRWAKLMLSKTRFDDQDAVIIWAADITEEKHSAAMLKIAVEEAEKISEMKSNFLATMSHEIRTPMQSIYGLLELIAEAKPDQKIMDMVNTARNSSSGLLEILDDILDLAKVDAGKMELDLFEVPVRTLIYGVLEGMEVKVHGKDIELKADVDEDVPFVVLGDPKRLRQILLNLIGNAMKFTERGSITVHISLEPKVIPTPKDGLALRCEIIDTGIGMTDEVADKLFQPFTQADSSTTRKYGGTGLGLSICQKLVDLMGGAIGVDSDLSQGSTFWFEIPTQAITEEIKTELPDLDGIAVLSVEDHPQGAKEIVNSLRSMGAEIEQCSSYAEAIELAKRRPYDVAVVDQGLPDGLGIDLLKEMSKIRPFMGLILYTVRDDAGMQQSAKTIGATFLSKPASRLGLGEAVKAAAKQAPIINVDGPRRLLIAEDTASVRDVIQRQLSNLGVEADFVENGVQALVELDKEEHGILITDLHMPEMDGYSLVSAIREKEEKYEVDKSSRFPVIVLTADVQLAQRQAYMSHGFDECLLKPVSLGQLRQLLIRWGALEEQSFVQEQTTMTEEAITQTDPDELPPAVNKDAIIDQMGAFDESVIEMLGLFVEMTEPVVENIQAALENDDQIALVELAHSLKGGARSACCTRLGDLASTLQDSADASDSCHSLIKHITIEFDRVKEEIKNLSI